MDASRKLVNRTRKDERLAWLASYDRWKRGAGLVGCDWFARPLLAEGNVVLAGQVDRVDFLQGEVFYRGILLREGGELAGWRDEPAFPLLQYGLASRYGRPAEEFGVGVQCLDGSEPQVAVYSRKEIETALAMFQLLAKRLSGYMR